MDHPLKLAQEAKKNSAHRTSTYSCYSSTLGALAHGKVSAKFRAGRAKWGEWKQNPNICATAWTPWPIVWVDNGNHSTMAAILTHGGQLKTSETFDAKELLLSVYTDGANWLRVDNNQVIAPVTSLPMAAIFEIGRRLIKAPRK